MSAALQQSALIEAFERPAEVRGAVEAGPAAPARDLADILLAHGRIGAEAAARIRETMGKTGRSFAWCAGKLKAARPADIEIALAIRERFLKDDAAAFRLARDLVLLRRPLARQAEQFRLLRTRLATTQSGPRLKGLAVAPAGRGVKGAYVAANLAAAFAQLQRRTLLIDADLRRPALARIFGLAPALGLAACLSQSAEFEEVARPSPVADLWIAAAEESLRDPQPLLAGARLEETLEKARSGFDVVIILTAPFGTAADGQFVWAAANSALVVARRDFTRAEELSQLGGVLRQVGADVLGAVMTR